jgi:hypothetical protein
MIGCALCEVEDMCIKCAENYTLNKEHNKCMCDDGTYMIGEKCLSCGNGCDYCNADRCLRCRSPTYTLVNGVCQFNPCEEYTSDNGYNEFGSTCGSCTGISGTPLVGCKFCHNEPFTTDPSTTTPEAYCDVCLEDHLMDAD